MKQEGGGAGKEGERAKNTEVSSYLCCVRHAGHDLGHLGFNNNFLVAPGGLGHRPAGPGPDRAVGVGDAGGSSGPRVASRFGSIALGVPGGVQLFGGERHFQSHFLAGATQVLFRRPAAVLRTAHELAVIYNDRSPLENMHCLQECISVRIQPHSPERRRRRRRRRRRTVLPGRNCEQKAR